MAMFSLSWGQKVICIGWAIITEDKISVYAAKGKLYSLFMSVNPLESQKKKNKDRKNSRPEYTEKKSGTIWWKVRIVRMPRLNKQIL